MDENIKELTQTVEENIDAELSAEVSKFKSRAGYSRSLSKEKKSSLVARAKKIVNSSLLLELGKVLEILSEFEGEGNDKFSQGYYILIDKIDDKWVDDTIRYQMIRALIECLKSFRKIQNLKIIVALRSDVLERVFQESNHPGFQREKYDDYILRLKWDKTQLKKMVNKRINFLYRKKYPSEQVFYADVFDPKVGKIDSFLYMIDRTQLRPRDIIAFINKCLENSEGKNKVTQRVIRKSESDYSRVRLQALTDEWESAFPALNIAFEVIAKQGHGFKAVGIRSKKIIEQLILEVGDQFDGRKDPLCVAISNSLSLNNDIDFDTVGRILLSELYRVDAMRVFRIPCHWRSLNIQHVI
jgi:hypothetical protein